MKKAIRVPLNIFSTIYCRLRLYAIPLALGLFVVTPLMDLAVRIGLVKKAVSEVSELLPYESPALRAFGDHLTDEAFGGSPG